VAEGALSGTKVVDLTQARAGPTCVRILADLGADVIQVIRPSNEGNIDSSFPNFDRENMHRNKRSVAINLQTEAGRDVLLRLVKDADVVVENFRADVKHRLRIDYETLCALNPRLVYGSISGFGQTGPYAKRPGVDQIAQGLGGLMSITGPPGGGPWRVGIAISDLAAGMFLAHGILAALLERERSGRGQWVQTSLLEAMISLLDFQATRWLIGKEVPPQAGNDHPTLFPMGVFETADGLINIAASGGRMWRDFLDVIGRPELAQDARFAEPASRAKNRQPLRDACNEALRTKTTQEWIEALNGVGVPAGPILSVDEVFEDAQVRHLAMAQPLESPIHGTLNVLRSPIGLSRTPASLRNAAPRSGEDTLAVLRELGLAESEIDALVAQGVVGT
jgi:crotonobetainyl-CoA:carnitine CoA-transferase CaiB-like acyl-CoA transferase